MARSHRLFLAIAIDPASRAAILGGQQRLRAELGLDEGFRFVPTDQLHLTLVFIGHVDEGTSVRITESFERPLAAAPFTIAIGGHGVFPPRGAPRVLWLDIAGGASELRDVQRLVVARLTSLAVRFDDRAFTPHLTLGRWRHSRPSDRPRLTDSSRPPEIIARVEADAVTLFESRLSTQRAVHAPLAEARLEGRGPA